MTTESHNGLPGPTSGTPPLRPGSVRRTTSMDLSRPDGPDGPIRVSGRARTVGVDADGVTHVLDTALTSIVVLDGVVTTLRTYPVREAAAALVGRQALVGWRTGLWRTLREEVTAGTALHQLLDDLPGVMVIGGLTRRRALAAAGASVAQPGRRLDVCAGWATGSRAARVLAATGSPPPPVTPPAPALTGDQHGWHTLPELPPWGMSRRRRVDVHHGGDDGPEPGTVSVEAMFRDSFRDGDGDERVLHEIGVLAGLEPSSLALQSISVSPRVLPHRECPVAMPSADALLGVDCGRLREVVSAQLFGPSSCTHLNDLMRSLADVPALRTLLPGVGSPHGLRRGGAGWPPA